MGSSCDDELQYVGRGRSLKTDDVQARREQVIDGSSSGLCENHRNCRTVVVRGVHRSIDGRQLHMNLVNVSSRAVVMVVAVGVALVDVQYRCFGIEAEESCTQEERDRPHLGSLT